MPTTILTAGTEAALNADVATANAASSGAYEIDLTSNITENADPTAIDLKSGVTLVIKGGGANANTIDGGGIYRGLFVYSGAVTVESLTLKDMTATGGAGVSGGGGGAGLGGALFVASGGSLTLSQVTMSGDKAAGGGGSAAPTLLGGGGGGGGMGGRGGPTDSG